MTCHLIGPFDETEDWYSLVGLDGYPSAHQFRGFNPFIGPLAVSVGLW